MIWFYRICFLPALFFSLPYYITRMLRRGGYGESFAERFGFYKSRWPRPSGQNRIWFHAVSVGEILALGPLLKKLNEEPGVEFLISTTTSTGFRVAREKHGLLARRIIYFPVDFWWFSARAWRQVDPSLVVLIENERWPEHLHQAASRGVPVLVVNARLSDRSFRRAHFFRRLLPSLMPVQRTLAASGIDEERLRAAGLAGDRLEMVGNIKLDTEIPRLTPAEVSCLQDELGFDGAPVLLGSSTWSGEEQVLIEAFRTLRERGFSCNLLLVPRHAERRGELKVLLENSGFSFHLRSTGPCARRVDVALGDTTGELANLTQVATLVFIGKSLPPLYHEGQTPVEAAGLGRPILLGLRMTNFRSIAQSLCDCGAARRVEDARDLIAQINALWSDEDARERMGAAGVAWHLANRGAVDKTVAAIREELSARQMN